MNVNIRFLSKLHSIVEMTFFVLFFEKFSDYMYTTYTLKIYQKNSSKTSHFSNQSEFQKEFAYTHKNIITKKILVMIEA